MNMIESVTTCLSKYFTFKGVATRPEYWWFLVIIAECIDGNSTNYWDKITDIGK